jgi:exodeoxyribonuclease V beta subunit
LSDEQPFDVCGPLPDGVTVLEASAGTGKTYTIAALAARYVADGTPLHELLVVTFTRMATGELRERVRERLLDSERALARVMAGAPASELDALARLLAAGPRAEVAVRHERLARAVANFDAATIATTHGFCQEVLAELGTLGDFEPDVAFVEDVDDLLAEVLDDLYVRRFHRHGGAPLTRSQAMRIARIAIENPAAPVQPLDAPEQSVRAMRRRLALAVRAELERRKRALGVMTYDDLLTRLRDTLAGPHGEVAAARLRARYRVVLIDEFQDTDPIQWEIVRRAFASRPVTLVLIADPKQAIYAFRGADVYAYLEAVKTAGRRATLAINRRSDQPLIDAYDALFAGAKLGHDGIVYRVVRAAPTNQAPGLSGAPVTTALRIRVVERSNPALTLTANGYASSQSAREHIARDLAADLVALLSSDARVERGEPIRPGHVAVLVQRHRAATLIHAALEAVGIPAVMSGSGSVFGTASAGDWLALLQSIERPTSASRARAAALTPFFGWTAERVAGAEESDWEDLHQRLHRFARVLRSSGVATLAETITVSQHLPGRVLAFTDGERRLTDLRHIAQLLQRAATDEQLGTTALAAWLHARIEAAEQESSGEERTRRLESDGQAVQVLTIHRSKGLEFPIVYCPYLWEPWFIAREPRPIFYHDPDADDERTIDVGTEGPDFQRHRRQHELEQRGEELRLAYVALTRARHQAVVWWAGSRDSRDSPLGRLLFARGEHGGLPARGKFTPTDAAALVHLRGLAAHAPGCISVESASLGLPAEWSELPQPSGELAAAELRRRLDARWRRTSYTDMTARVHDAAVASEPEEGLLSDEPEAPTAPTVADADNDDAAQFNTPSLLAGLPTGVATGTLVHRVLEATDFAAEDIERELDARLTAALAGRPLAADRAQVLAGLRAAIEAPLLPGVRLRDLARSDRLDELRFELPIAGGDEPTGALALTAIARLLETHLPADDPLSGYAARLEDPVLARDVRGYLTGTIDLVARIGGRFAIVDYKTNWLAPSEAQLTTWHYRPAALAAEMQQAHYGLQALLYTVALHRYLRWRLCGYEPARDLAGVVYLFLRGAPGGAFTWRPSGALVQSLSDVFDGKRA